MPKSPLFGGLLGILGNPVSESELPITMFVSTHDMKLVEELFPRTIVMDEGVIVADGKTKDILADEKLLEAHGLEKP